MADVLVSRSPRVFSRTEKEVLKPVNLFANLGTMLDWLSDAVESSCWLDVYLVAAGIQQLVEDHSGTTRLIIRRAGPYLSRSRIDLLGRIGRGATAVDWALEGALARLPRNRDLAMHSNDIAEYLRELAFVLLARYSSSSSDASLLQSRGRTLGETLRPLSMSFANEIVRLPSCFRSFDQRPADVGALVSKFADTGQLQDRPVCVVGVRTSGSYLAPLCAAALVLHGFTDVNTISIRPSWPLAKEQKDALRRAVDAGGRVLILDDPPASGRSIERVVDDLDRKMNIRPESVALLLGVFASPTEFSGILQRTTIVTLPFEAWDFQHLLEATVVKETLGRLLGDASDVLNVRATPTLSAVKREHVARIFDVEIRDAVTGVSTWNKIVVQGVGLGYFGRHAVAISERAPRLFPSVIGLEEGFLYYRELPSSDKLAISHDRRNVAAQLASHVAERKNLLRVDSDPSIFLAGRQPVWEVAANIVGRSLGPLSMALHGSVVAPLVRRILYVTDPSIPDCMTSTDTWFSSKGSSPAVKANFAEGPFSHLDLASFDAAFDLAGIAVAADSEEFSVLLRGAYERYGSPIEPERWMLLQLVHSWNEQRLERVSRSTAARRNSRIVHRYFAERFLADISSSTDGPWCALDLDGVLETSPLGFPATTLAGALALRSLVAHGYRVILASGRSLSELAERCETYALFASVAEYGSVIYDHLHKTTIDLVPEHDANQLFLLRNFITNHTDIVVDDDYERIVRVYQIDDRGRRRGLDSEQATKLLKACPCPEAVVTIHGDEQTDFVASSIDKGKAICILLQHLGGATGAASDGTNDLWPLEFAIGDSATDGSFLRLAQRSFAPANANQVLRKSGTRIVRQAYQAGTAAAVANLIGHQPGSCPTCGAPHMDDASLALVDLLSIQEGGRWGAIRRVLRLVRSSFPGIRVR
jgi:hydroxymethylpyrimidine pyrophosphatase-like HAD family hydrolase